jgi:hypothetical protein
MVPTNASAIVAFFLLTAPGVIFELMRERRRPGLSDSVLREASRIILASTVFTCSAFLVLASLFHEACCVNGLAWFGCACRIDDPHRLDGFATLDRTFEWFDTA